MGVWTIDELVDRVGAALAAAAYTGAPNGRVREVPDRRAVRWYATIGLVDRPGAMRGRVALYGPRHLLQLVAVKRRQAEGRTIAEIQAELTGATDATLAAIAHVPQGLLAAGDAPADVAPTRPRFWAAAAPAAAAPAAAAPAAAAPAAAAAASPEANSPAVSPAAAARDAIPAAAQAPSPTQAPLMASAPTTDRAAMPDRAARLRRARNHRIDVVSTLAGVSFDGGALLLLPAHPTPDDLAAIDEAAQPLLDLLADRGLLAPRPTQT